jgi:RNA polymerase sigma-70 factor (ECF subfamily)
MVAPDPTTTLSREAVDRLLASRQEFLAFLKRRISSPETAEDILQAAFVKGIEKGGGIKDEETVVAWFYRLLRNAVIDYYRQHGVSERAQASLLREMETHQEPDVSFRGDICGCISGLLDTLKPEYQRALNTVDLQERSLRDLAGEAHITENNAAVRIHRARQALRKQVMATCGICAAHGCVDCTCKSNL